MFFEKMWCKSENHATKMLQSTQESGWREAMKKKINVLEANEPWTLTYLPGMKTIDSKWVHKTIMRPDGTTERSKTHISCKR